MHVSHAVNIKVRMCIISKTKILNAEKNPYCGFYTAIQYIILLNYYC